MSKNTNLSFLTDFLTADIVNSRVGMNNVSPQATFDVTGTGKFSGILTLGSTISNGTYTYTLPSATGTLALTSDIPTVTGYVPYTGATQDVDLGIRGLTANGIVTFSIYANGAGTNAGQIYFKHNSVFSLPSGYGSIGSGNSNEFKLYQVTNLGVFRGATLSLNGITASETRNFAFPDASGTIALVGGAGVGTVTSVAALTLGTSGTDLSSTVANGTTTPVITLNVPTASATNRGALSSADWTTFNGKQNALTNPVTGTGTIGQVAYFTGTSAISSESNLFWDATNDRLGIGTSTPGTRLDVKGAFATNSSMQIDNGGPTYGNFMQSNGSAGYDRLSILGSDIQFYGSGTVESMRITTNRNLHIGTFSSDNGASLQVSGTARVSDSITIGPTDSVWNLTTSNKLQLQNSLLIGYSTIGTFLTMNLNFNGAWKYISNGFASLYSQDSGEHIFFTSTSSTGGANATLNEKLRITNSGNVGIGTLNPSTLLNLKSSTTTELRLESVGGTYRSFIGFRTDGQKWDLGVNLNDLQDALSFNYSGSEQARMTTGGNLLIGTTSDNGNKLRVNGTALIGAGISNFQTSTKTGSSGSTVTFLFNADFGTGLGDNTSGLVIININEPNFNANGAASSYIGNVINPRGLGGSLTQISSLSGSGVSSFAVAISGNNINVTATISGGGQYRATMTFIGGGGTS